MSGQKHIFLVFSVPRSPCSSSVLGLRVARRTQLRWDDGWVLGALLVAEGHSVLCLKLGWDGDNRRSVGGGT